MENLQNLLDKISRNGSEIIVRAMEKMTKSTGGMH